MKDSQRNIANIRTQLLDFVGSQEPIFIRKRNDEVVVKFIRGFADPDRNIVLISEESHSRGMNIIEIKNIQEIQPWIQSAA